MKIILVILIFALIYIGIQDQYNKRYDKGYADGVKHALRTNPPSEELELVCAGLWIGEQNKKADKKNAR